LLLPSALCPLPSDFLVTKPWLDYNSPAKRSTA